MTYNFDEPRDRRTTNSLKWDYAKRFTGREGLLPLWVADMDFATPPAITEALVRRIEHGIFGYAQFPPSYFESVRMWVKKRHDWEISEDWIVPIPGIVPGIRIAVEAYTHQGEKIIIQPPVYYPFRNIIAGNGRQVLENPLTRDGSRYLMNFEQLEGIVDDDTRALLLCSPHNPVSRVWNAKELGALAELCTRRGLLLISDEIHCDLIMSGSRHLPAATFFPERENRSITFMSATKSFNLSGISCANAIIPDPFLRKTYSRQVMKEALQLPNLVSIVAAEAAYRHGEEWLTQVLAYIESNYRYLVEFLKAKTPELTVFPLEGTYLVWVDLSTTGLGDEEIKTRLLDEGLWLDDGPMFGSGGAGFQRINIACPRATLEDAMNRFVRAVGR
ncbi:MAG TPA: MalY/PatB family protein [Spirochaetia bacterium]|nr:MalY/PatB family protein [Spirochaetia bacterium]